MLDTDETTGYLERAEMHEQLAAATSDLPARKMHLAMAAEYRRKASEAGEGMLQATIARSGTSMLMAEANP